MISDLVVLPVVYGLAVWTIARLAPVAELGLLPRRRRRRVEWCREHVTPALAASGVAVIGVLAVALAT